MGILHLPSPKFKNYHCFFLVLITPKRVKEILITLSIPYLKWPPKGQSVSISLKPRKWLIYEVKIPSCLKFIEARPTTCQAV